MAERTNALWGLHAGVDGPAEKLFLTHGYIGMSWVRLGNMTELPTEVEAFRKTYEATYPNDRNVPLNAGQIHRFVHEIEVGDCVAFRPHLTDQGNHLIFLGRVIGPYLYNPFLVAEYPHLRRVDWLRSLPLARFSDAARRELGTNLSLFQINHHAAEFLAAIAEAK